MELIELVSSHVTVPVIGVVLCALMVFTFGFRSPAQPPSFTFEEHPEKKSKKRSKQAKVKSSTNSNVKTTNSSAETPSKATPDSPKVGLVLPSKPKSEIRKETTQDLKGEKKLKLKKEAGKGGAKIPNVQAGDAPLLKKENEEGAGEWTTIQMSKKSKKPKPSKKDNPEQVESLGEAPESDTAPELEVAAFSPVVTADTAIITAVSPTVAAVSPAEVPTSPESNSNRNKKRKEKLAEKKQAEEKVAPTDAVDIKPVPVESSKPQSEEPGPSKKKNKKDKKPVSEVSASVSEAVVSHEMLVPAAAEQKVVNQTLTQVEAAELPSIEKTKPVQKKKKNAVKEIVQKEATQTAPDMQIRQPEKSVEAAENSVTPASSKAVKLEAGESDASPAEQQQPSPVTANPSPVGISFDEIGDAWVDAAPKSKKKKARRDN